MFGEPHLRRLLKSYQKYYNEARTEGRTRTQRLAPRFDQRIDGFRLTLEPRGNGVEFPGAERAKLLEIDTPNKESEVSTRPFLGGAVVARLSR